MDLDRTDHRSLLLPGAMPLQRQIALKSWLKRYWASAWMRDEKGWLENACLLASSRVDGPWEKQVLRTLYCGSKGRLCGLPDFCNRDALDRRVEPAQREFGPAFDRAPHSYALVLASELDPRKAGLWLEWLREPWLPFAGERGLDLLTDPIQFNDYQQAELLGDFVRDLAGVVGGGAFCRIEPDLLFRRSEPGGSMRGHGDHAALVHANVLLNAPGPIEPRTWRTIFRWYAQFWARLPYCQSYPDLWVDQIGDRAGLETWLGYSLKPWELHKWFLRARRAGREDAFDLVLANLDYHHDELRTRACGNLSALSGEYIGRRKPMRLSNKEINQWLNDPAFAALHPDWEDSIIQILEKRKARRGRGRKVLRPAA